MQHVQGGARQAHTTPLSLCLHLPPAPLVSGTHTQPTGHRLHRIAHLDAPAQYAFTNDIGPFFMGPHLETRSAITVEID